MIGDQLIPGRVGIISDIHGNAAALAAVLADGAAEDVHSWMVLGDVVAMGAQPGAVLELLDTVDIIAEVRGNTDRYVLSGDRPPPTPAQVTADPSLLPTLTEVEGSFSWTRGFLSGAGSLDRLQSFTPEHRFVLADGTRLLAIHASGIADDGPGITPGLSVDEATRLFPNHEADIVVGGHTHRATDIMLDGVRFLNPGSVSNHDQPHLPATYLVLHTDPSGHRVEHRDVVYDKDAARQTITDCGIPGAGFLLSRYFGQ